MANVNVNVNANANAKSSQLNFNNINNNNDINNLNNNSNNNSNNNNSLENLLNSSQSFSTPTTLTSELSLSSIFWDPGFPPPLSPPFYDHPLPISPSDSPPLSHELSASSICSPELDFFNDFGSRHSPFDSECALHAQLASPISPFDLAQGLGLPIPNIHLADIDLHNGLPLPIPLDQLSPSNLLAHPPFSNNEINNNNNTSSNNNMLDSPITDLVQKPPPGIFDHSLPNSLQVPEPMTLLPEQKSQLATHSLPETASPTSSDPPATSPGPPSKKKPSDRSSTRHSDPREDFLKRNRVAASKSRAKKKEWQESLEARAQGLGKENVELKKQVRILTVELERLRKLLGQQENLDYNKGSVLLL